MVSLLLLDSLEPVNACKMEELVNEAKPSYHFHVPCCVFTRLRPSLATCTLYKVYFLKKLR